jgi:hypothetical protein
MPIKRGAGREQLAIGATLKYVMGNGLLAAQDGQAVIGNTPVADTLRFPVVMLYDKSGNSFVQASGVGMDIGIAASSQTLDVGLTVHDLFNTLKFDPNNGKATDGFAFVNSDSSAAEFDLADVNQASPELAAQIQNAVDRSRFKPTFRFGAAWRGLRKLLVATDVMLHTGNRDRLRLGRRLSAGAGVEYQLLHWLPVRGGFAADGDGVAGTIGGGLQFGSFHFDVSAGYWTSKQRRLGVGLSWGAN